MFLLVAQRTKKHHAADEVLGPNARLQRGTVVVVNESSTRKIDPAKRAMAGAIGTRARMGGVELTLK